MAERLHAASFSERSGISRYAGDFHDLVLQARGFRRVEPDAESVAAANLVRLQHQIHRARKRFAIDGNREAVFEADAHFFRRDLH